MAVHGVATSQTVTMLAQSNGASHTGDLVETTLLSGTVSANSMGANGVIRVVLNFNLTGTAGIKTFKVKFGGTTVMSPAAPSTATSYRLIVDIANQNATNAQQASAQSLNNAGSSTLFTGSSAIDTTASQTVAVTGTLASAADSVTMVTGQALLFSKA